MCTNEYEMAAAPNVIQQTKFLHRRFLKEWLNTGETAKYKTDKSNWTTFLKGK